MFAMFLHLRIHLGLFNHFMLHNSVLSISLQWRHFSTCRWDRTMPSRELRWDEFVFRFPYPLIGEKQQFLWKPLKWATFMAEDLKEEDEALWSSVETPLRLAGLGEFPFLSAVFYLFSSHVSFTLLLPAQIFKQFRRSALLSSTQTRECRKSRDLVFYIWNMTHRGVHVHESWWTSSLSRCNILYFGSVNKGLN